MSDLTISRKLGDTTAPRTQGTTAATTALATITNAPAALANANVGTLIKALVASQTARGLTTLQTDKGILTLQTSIPLKPGSEVTVQIQTSGAQSRVQILSVDHQPLATTGGHAAAHAGDGSRSPLPTGAPGTQGGNGGLPAKSAVSPGTSSGPATATSPDARNAATQTNRGPLVAGLVLPGRIVSTGAGNALGVTTQGNPGGPNSSSLAIAIGDTLTLRIVATAPGNVAPPLRPSVPLSHDGTPLLYGKVIEASAARNESGASAPQSGARTTVVAVGDSRISLPAPPPGPAGSQVLMEVLDNRQLPARGPGSPGENYAHFLRLGADWPALKQTVEALALATSQGAPGAADGTDTIVPRSGPQLASSLLFFISALSTGNLRAWLGDARQDAMMQAGHGQILRQLGDDFASMARHAADSQGTGWHALAMPMQNGPDVAQLRLFYRRQNRSGNDGDSDTATHFVVEADLSRIGLFQLEGLVRPRHFDLAVHSTRVLDNAMQCTIREIFQEALSTGDLAGTIRFDAGDNKPFNPPGMGPATGSTHAATLVA